ncbi:hypothetical protein V8B97DRAFT_832462 [Scleroderma yunnanense]
MHEDCYIFFNSNLLHVFSLARITLHLCSHFTSPAIDPLHMASCCSLFVLLFIHACPFIIVISFQSEQKYPTHVSRLTTVMTFHLPRKVQISTPVSSFFRSLGIIFTSLFNQRFPREGCVS